jgi:CheY-like chemotaxis protein
MAVLVAGTADAVHTARLIIGEAFDYRLALSLEQARAGLRPAPQLIVCSMRFDDARMLDFLKALREEPEGSRLPVVCFHAHGWDVSASARAALQAVLQTLDNASFVDLYAIARACGVAAATTALREAVASALGRRAAEPVREAALAQ